MSVCTGGREGQKEAMVVTPIWVSLNMPGLLTAPPWLPLGKRFLAYMEKHVCFVFANLERKLVTLSAHVVGIKPLT